MCRFKMTYSQINQNTNKEIYFKEEFPGASRLDCSLTEERMPIGRKFGMQNLENFRNFSLNPEYLGPYARTSLVMTQVHQVILG